jgi:LmbE family N-acetylglucosaminyl deacetylase
MIRQFQWEFTGRRVKLVETEYNPAKLPSVDILVEGAAHNDDEMFPAGHLIRAIDEGQEVGILVATDGAGSSYKDISGQELVDLRTEESRRACEALGAVFLIGYDHPSSHLKSDEGLASFAGELTDILNQTNPTEVLVQTPIEDHYSHIRTTEGAITAARNAKVRPERVLGYDVWTPQFRLPLTQIESMDEATANKKLWLQSMFDTQVHANPYQDATRALNLYCAIMADSHKAAGLGYAEAFLDMNPLVHDERFADFTAAEFGGGLLLLAQTMRTSGIVQLAKRVPTKKDMLDLLANELIPAYREISQTLDCYAASLPGPRK